MCISWMFGSQFGWMKCKICCKYTNTYHTYGQTMETFLGNAHLKTVVYSVLHFQGLFYLHGLTLIPAWINNFHYDDVIMTMLASQITSLTVVYSIVYSGVNQRKHQSSASLAFVREIHRGPVNFPHKWPVTRKMFPFDDVIMIYYKMWDEITYSFPNVNDCTSEV